MYLPFANKLPAPYAMRIINDKYDPILFKAADLTTLPPTPWMHTNKATGTFGEMLHRSFQSENCTIHDFDIRINEALTLQFPAEPGGAINLNVCLKGHTNWLVKDQQQSIQKHEYILYDGSVDTIALQCMPGTSCRFLTITYHLNKLRKLGVQYNGMKEFISNHLRQLGKGKAATGYASNAVIGLFDDIAARTLPPPVLAPLLDAKITAILLELFVELYARDRPAESSSSIQAICEQARAIILQDVSQRHSVSGFANRFRVDQLYLQASFKKRFGVSLFNFLRKRRLEHARHLLLTTNTPLKDISRQAGYRDSVNFTAAFKTYFGYTPGSVRRKK